MAVKSARSEVFAERAVMDGVSACDQLVDGFGGNQQDGLSQAAVDLRMGAQITFDPERSDKRFRNRPLRKPTARDVNLDDVTCHILWGGYQPAPRAFTRRNTARTRTDAAATLSRPPRSCACSR